MEAKFLFLNNNRSYPRPYLFLLLATVDNGYPVILGIFCVKGHPPFNLRRGMILVNGFLIPISLFCLLY